MSDKEIKKRISELKRIKELHSLIDTEQAIIKGLEEKYVQDFNSGIYSTYTLAMEYVHNVDKEQKKINDAWEEINSLLKPNGGKNYGD